MAMAEVNDDWRCSGQDNGHLKRFTHSLETGYESDVVFIVGEDKKELKAHKLILSIGSKVFKQMFKEDKNKTSFELPDVDSNTFWLLLKFLYTGECTKNIEDGLPLLVAASKYNIPDLMRICGDLLSEELKAEAALRLFQQALKYKSSGLEERALKFICRRASKIVESAEFLELGIEELAKILARDDLRVKDETQIFAAVLNWGRAECKRQKSPESHKYLRSVLERVIPLIRFPLMDPSDFTTEVASTQILLTEEVMSVLLYFNVKPERRATVSTGVFNSKPRTPYIPTGGEYTLRRLVKQDSLVMNLATNQSTDNCYITLTSLEDMEQSIMFKSSTSILVTSLGMNCCVYSTTYRKFTDDRLSIKLQIKDSAENVLATKDETISGVKTRTQVHHAQFEKPIPIDEDLWYTASFTITNGTMFGASYVPANGSGDRINFKLPDGSKSEIEFQFKTVANPTFTGIGQGFIPEIRFKID